MVEVLNSSRESFYWLEMQGGQIIVGGSTFEDEAKNFTQKILLLSRNYFKINECLEDELRVALNELIRLLLDSSLPEMSFTFLKSLVKEFERRLSCPEKNVINLILRASCVYYAYKFKNIFSLEKFTLVENFLEAYPNFITERNLDSREMENLLRYRNFLINALSIFGTSRHKKNVIEICTFLEGSTSKYTAGSYKSAATKRREMIYCEEVRLLLADQSLFGYSMAAVPSPSSSSDTSDTATTTESDCSSFSKRSIVHSEYDLDLPFCFKRPRNRC